MCFPGFPREDKEDNDLVKTSELQNIPRLGDTPSKKVEQRKKLKKKRREKKGRRKISAKKRKSKRGKKKSRTKKRNKSKARKKLRKANRRRKNGKGKKQNARQENSNCKNLTCLNDILEVLKVDKDTVQNFIQQNRRLKSRLELAGFQTLSSYLRLPFFHLISYVLLIDFRKQRE